MTTTTTWNGKFFETDRAEVVPDYEPDHVLTVSELMSEPPTPPAADVTVTELAKREEDDYRQLLAEVRHPYVPPVEKKLSRGIKLLLLVLALTGSIAGAALVAALLPAVAKEAISVLRQVLSAIATGLFLFASFAYFCTKGKTEKLLLIILVIAGALTLLSLFISI